MEKFAIDLDKVLDDFEFNEDCAEQVASVDPLANTSTSVNKCNLESSSANACNYVLIESEHSSKELGNTSALEENVYSQKRSSESIYLSERNSTTDNPNYSKDESLVENMDSVNHFYTHEYTTENKLTQKQSVPPCDSEQALTIYNDISQKLLQKQQNGSNSPVIDNRYDKKLNQPNIKPSVSNVFTSLNEYINAPPGSLNYATSVVNQQEIKCNMESDNIQVENGVPIKNTVFKQCIVVKNHTNNSNVGVAHSETCTLGNTAREVLIPDYQNIIVPVNVEPFIDHRSNVDQSNTESIRTINFKNIESENFQSEDMETVGVKEGSAEYECDNTSTDASLLNSGLLSSFNSKSEPENREVHGDYNLRHMEENTEKSQESDLRKENNDTLCSSAYNQNQENISINEMQLEFTTKKTVFQFDSEERSGAISSILCSERIGDTGSISKPFEFTNLSDLSEDDLNKYLTELECDGVHIETDNVCNTTLVQSTTETTENKHAAPVLETAAVGEDPRVSEEESNVKEKNISTINHSSISKKEEALSNCLGNQESEQVNELGKINFAQEECKSPAERRKSKDETTDNVSKTASKENASIELLSDVKNNSSRCQHDYTILQKDGTPEVQKIHDVPQHCIYDLNVEQELLNNIEIDIQKQKSGVAMLDSTQCNEDCDLNAQAIMDGNNEERCAATYEKNVLDDYITPTNVAISNTLESSFKSNVNDSIDESGKPTRPQTLGVVSMDDPSKHQMCGSTSIGESGLVRSDIDSAKDDCQGSSPDALDNTSSESSSVLGKQPPFWVPDSDAPSCMLCEVKFTVLKRRHHCRACGKVLCNKCCNMKYKLEYQGNIDSRVCVPCYQLLIKAESEQGIRDWPSTYTMYMSSDINSPQGRQPNPNNPMEYCSTIPPLQQLTGGLPPPPTVMVPVGVLKREGGTKHRPEGSKSVMFSDGIRPGCDLTELDMSWDLKPPYRKSGNKKIPTPGSSLTSTMGKRQNLPCLDSSTDSYVPQDPNVLPPTVTIHKGQVSYHAVTDEGLLYKTLKNECEPPVMFAINRNLYAYVKISNLNCCVNKVCWNITSKGLACVGQDEIILLVETLPDETRIPKDLLIFINQLYIEATKGNTVSELGFSVYQGGNLLSSREHAGFLFIRQTLQCLQKIIQPAAPFLVGLLVHRWETPWAKVFPLRLLLRLGAEYRYYPCPLVSVRFRDALYFEIGHTVMKVLADFRNFGYTLPAVRGLTIHLRNRMTDVMFPRNRYDQVIKGLNNSNDHVLAYASNFSISADSHLVCIQTNTGDESCYQTQAINIHNKPRTVTGASFIVINGALKSSMGLSAKSSIVEDGLMVEIMPEKMEALKAALKNMQDFSIGCGRQGASEPDETVNIKWVDNDTQFNIGVKSPIDGQLMDGIPSIRVHNGTDFKGTSRFIRWTEVFIIKSDDHPNGVHDPVDINKLSGNIAKATCTALVKLLDLLATAGLTKLGVRTTIHPDNVGYEAGSEGTKLPPIYMKSLDNELIQVLHKAAQNSQDTHTVLELIFYVLDD